MEMCPIYHVCTTASQNDVKSCGMSLIHLLIENILHTYAYLYILNPDFNKTKLNSLFEKRIEICDAQTSHLGRINLYVEGSSLG